MTSTGHAGGLPSRQADLVGTGTCRHVVAMSFDYHYIDRLAYPFYGIMLVLLDIW